jgi:hypothetical protein
MLLAYSRTLYMANKHLIHAHTLLKIIFYKYGDEQNIKWYLFLINFYYSATLGPIMHFLFFNSLHLCSI